jgi:hypothetical protein
MAFNLMIWTKDLLEVLFFTGLIGCIACVLLSWVSILKSAFSENPED